MTSRHGIQKDGQYTLVPMSAVSVEQTHSGDVVPADPNSGEILGQFIDWHHEVFGVRLPRQQCGRLGREIKRCLDSEYPIASIKWGMLAWCSYFIEDPTKPPPTLDSIVYCILMRQRGHQEFVDRARSTGGLAKRGKASSSDIAAQSRSAVDEFRRRQRGQRGA